MDILYHYTFCIFEIDFITQQVFPKAHTMLSLKKEYITWKYDGQSYSRELTKYSYYVTNKDCLVVVIQIFTRMFMRLFNLFI